MPESSDNSSKRRAKRVPVGNRPSVPGEGTVVLGDFELRREIGRGGMGTVYEAWQRSLQRVVALKVLGQHISSSSNAVQRFKREAHAAARLHHTHIIPIFAQGEESGVYYYAMELVEGPTLNDIISTARQRLRILPDAFPNELDETVPLDRSQDEYGSEGEALRFADEAKSGFAPADAGVTEASLPAELTTLEHFVTVARHIASAAEALEYAHAEGVIHRDIKPHNLIMGVDNRLRISDFGLARISEEPGVAVTGELIGSPLYMSPEQIMEGSGRVDHRTDVYSLGATMYEWLTLSPPYPGDTREGVISKIVNSQPAAPRSLNPSVPVDLETICLKAIEADRNRRYQTAAALCKDLMRFLESRPIKARRIGPTVRLRRYIQRHQLASLTMVACSIVALLVSALFLAQREVRSQRREVEAQAVQIAEVKQRSEELLQLVSPLLPPGLEGSLSLVRAARPILEGVFESGAVSGGTADTAPARGADSALTGEPQGIARRAVRDLYNAIAPRYWSGSPMARDCSFAVLGGIQVQEAGAAKARRTVDRCLLADPDHIEARQLHLALCGQMRQYDTMASDAQQLIRQRSTEPTGHLWLGLARLLLDDAQRGLEDFDIAAEMVGHRDVRLVWAKALRGLALILLDQPGNARLELSEALVLAPNLVVALLSRACAGAALGDLPGAVADLDRVIAQEPNNADTIALRGEHSLAMGEFDAAIRDFNEAMRIAGPTARLQMQVLSALYLRQNMSKPRPAEPSPAQAPAVDSPTDESSSRGMLGRPAGLPGFDEPAVHRRASAPRSARAWFPFPLAFLP